MNKRFLILTILISVIMSVGLVSIFLFFVYNNQIKSIDQISLDIHSSYLQEIIYNYKNDLVSGNYRSFRNQISGMIDKKIFLSYRIIQGATILDSTEDFNLNLQSKYFSKIDIPIWFDEEKSNIWGHVELLINNDSRSKLFLVLDSKIGFFIFMILIVAVTLVTIYTFLWQRLNVGLIQQIGIIFNGKTDGTGLSLSYALWAPTLLQLKFLKQSNDKLIKAEQDNKIQSLMYDFSRQVAHDIRSPISVLNLVLNTLTDISGEKKELLLSATKRINEIANTVLLGGKPQAAINNKMPTQVSKEKPISLLAVVQSIVSEKKIQYSIFKDLLIETDLDDCLNVLVQGNSSDISRVLSNLINNSVEALNYGQGKVSIRAFGTKDYGVITILDNGKGIPDHIISKLGKEPISFGKEDIDSVGGTGLGFFNAKNVIEKIGGLITIRSIENQSTMVEIKIPLFKP